MSIEAMKQALEAFGAYMSATDSEEDEKAHSLMATAFFKLKEAIAEAEKHEVSQEPVSWESILGAVARGWCYEENANKTMDSELATAIAKEVHALYPKREWVGLTDEEMRELEKQFNAERVRTSDEEYLVIYPADYWDWQRAIEAKLKEKNT